MKFHSLIVEDFLEDFPDARRWATAAEFQDETNPLDGVVYPGIAKRVPTWGLRQRLIAIMGRDVQITAAFLRLSVDGCYVPHQAHSDSVMGDFSLMVYLNEAQHCQGGTSLVRHVSGMDETPTTQEGLALWEADMNRPAKWNPYLLCEMRPNRGFVFRASLMHRAEPIGGFGSTAHDGRLVMSAFFRCP